MFIHLIVTKGQKISFSKKGGLSYGILLEMKFSTKETRTKNWK